MVPFLETSASIRDVREKLSGSQEADAQWKELTVTAARGGFRPLA